MCTKARLAHFTEQYKHNSITFEMCSVPNLRKPSYKSTVNVSQLHHRIAFDLLILNCMWFAEDRHMGVKCPNHHGDFLACWVARCISCYFVVVRGNADDEFFFKEFTVDWLQLYREMLWQVTWIVVYCSIKTNNHILSLLWNTRLYFMGYWCYLHFNS